MMIHMNIKDQFVDEFNAFVNSLPKNAVKINEIDDNSISFEKAKEKVAKSINALSSNKGIDIEKAFEFIIKS